MNCVSVLKLWERCGWQRQGPDSQGALIVSTTCWHSCPKYSHRESMVLPDKTKWESESLTMYTSSKGHPSPQKKKTKKKSSLSPLVLPLVHLSLQVFSWCQVVSGMFLGSKVSLVLSCTAWKRWSGMPMCSQVPADFKIYAHALGCQGMSVGAITLLQQLPTTLTWWSQIKAQLAASMISIS